jgi:glycosyltransferase involved in cell wall biosynthesis
VNGPAGDGGLAQIERVRRNKLLVDQVRMVQAYLGLEKARRERPDPWAGEPLVSVRIATYQRPQLLVERAIASALRQTYQNLEVVVVGDHAGPETAAAVAAVKDCRVRYENLPARPSYPVNPRYFWATAGTYAVNRAIELCRGEWIAPLDDDDEFTADHVETLLTEARAKKLELVYGQMEVSAEGGWRPLGSAPLALGQVCHASVLYSARLAGLRYDALAFVEEDPGDWNYWKRMQLVGAKVGFLERVVGRHYPERTSLSPAERQAWDTRAPTSDEFIADVRRAGGARLLEMGASGR